jgi:hypothetical protein
MWYGKYEQDWDDKPESITMEDVCIEANRAVNNAIYESERRKEIENLESKYGKNTLDILLNSWDAVKDFEKMTGLKLKQRSLK